MTILLFTLVTISLRESKIHIFVSDVPLSRRVYEANCIL